MNWEKAETILIILFVFVNIFLICTLVITNVSNSYVKQDIIDSTVLLLEQNNIHINKSIIPKSIQSIPVLDVESAFSGRSQLADMVFGQNGYTQNDSTFSSEKGTLTFDRGIFTLTFFPKTNTTEITQKNALHIGEQLLQEIGFHTNNAILKGYYEENNQIFFHLVEQYYDLEFVTPTLQFELSREDSSVTIRGGWLGEKIIESKSNTTASAPSILADFLSNPDKGTQPITISEVKLMFYINSTDQGSDYKRFQAVPAYAITTDEARTYYYDARSGISAETKYLGFVDI